MARKITAAILLSVICLCLMGADRSKSVLHLYTWADYIKPELVERFEKQEKCKVVIDTFDSNESMYAKIKAGARGYDVIVPSSYMAKMMYKQGMLQDLKHDVLPNLAHIDPEYLKLAVDNEMKYSVPYMLTNTGLAYLKDRVTNVEPSWAMLDRADLKGRMTMLNDMRETIGAALKFLGYSLNTTNEEELAKARDVVIRWKKNLAKFESEQYKNGLASGEFLLVHGFSGDVLQAQSENDNVEFIAPKEGLSFSCDDMVIPKDAKNVELAHKLINFLHDPKVAAENTEFISYLCPNKDAYPLLSEGIRNNPAVFLDPAIRAKSEIIEDLGADNAKYTKVWDQIKAAE
jgi:spermidine/putrescine transport system substrate-binding protein